MKIQQGSPLPLGVTLLDGEKGVQISVWAKDKKECRLYLTKGGCEVATINMESMCEKGVDDIFSVRLFCEGAADENSIIDELKDVEYYFEADGEEFLDPYARQICGRETFGKPGKIRAGFVLEEFDWEGENHKTIDFSDMILYQCHVRGFTKHASSGVKNRGTFAGIVEKIPYLKQLGVNTLLCLPIYEFDEIIQNEDGKKKLNYWGYTKNAFYFAPKSSYCSDTDNPVLECKKMIKTLHQNEMNIMLDMHFEGQTPDYIVNCLRYYVTEFHIDGFLVNQNVVDSSFIMNDPVLRNVKLLGNGWPELPEEKRGIRLAGYNDGFLVDIRKFLKGDEGMVNTFYHRFRMQGENVAVINYITEKNGFTLKDLVSYDIKHNEKNDERNQDGRDYNYSWNCGAEGTTRRKAVLALRKRQMKNAMTMLLLSMGTPMILAGDEFGRTQHGNNNAYCQDNALSWVDWRLLEKNKELFTYVKQCIEFRKKQRFYDGRKMNGIDRKGLGAPDISCHGLEPWTSNFVNYSRELGILFYKNYVDSNASIYIAINMHWEAHSFFLPDVDMKSRWRVLFDTSEDGVKEMVSERNQYVLGPRTIAVFEEIPGPVSKSKETIIVEKDSAD